MGRLVGGWRWLSARGALLWCPRLEWEWLELKLWIEERSEEREGGGGGGRRAVVEFGIVEEEPEEMEPRKPGELGVDGGDLNVVKAFWEAVEVGDGR